MQRIDGPGHAGNLFTEGDPGMGTPATTVTDDWANDVQEELCNAIEDSDGGIITLVKGTQDQLKKAINKMIARRAEMGNHGRLVRNSATQIQLEAAQAGIQDFLVVNEEFVDISTPKTVDVSGGAVSNLLNASGGDSGGAPAASTLYYIYASNSQPAWSPSAIRLSGTAPTNGYLGSTGDAVHWRFVGAVRLDGSIEVAADWNLCGYGVNFAEAYLGSLITRSSGGADWYDILDFPSVVLLDNTKLLATCQQHIAYTNQYIFAHFYDDTASLPKSYSKFYAQSSVEYIASHSSSYKSASIQARDYKHQYFYYGAGTEYVYFDSSQTFTRLVRITL